VTSRRRRALLLLLIIPLGFATKIYAGPGSGWIANCLGGTFYVVFWVLVLLALFPTLSAGKVAVGVLAGTIVLEFLQLWHPPLLESLRSSFLGRTILGTTFSWIDIPFYILGAGLAYAAGRWARSGPGGGVSASQSPAGGAVRVARGELPNEGLQEREDNS
jgi:hypothetical protein